MELYTAVTAHAALPHRHTSDSPLRAPWPSSEGRGTCFSIFPLLPLVRPDPGSLKNLAYKLKKLKHDFRCTCTNNAWLSAGGHDGDRHADTDSKVSQDPMPPRSLLLPLSPPLHSSCWSPYAGTLPFGEFVLSDVCSKLTKLTGHAVRSTYTNKVWLCVGDHDGTKHPGTGCGIFRDFTSTPSPPPLPDTRHTHTYAPPSTIRMIYIRLATARAVILF